MGQLDNIKAGLIQLEGQASELKRDIAAAVLDRAKGVAGTEDRIKRLQAELRTNEDLQAAEKLALGHAAVFATEAATRDRHQRSHQAMADLAAMLDRRRDLGAQVDAAALALAAALRAFRENCTASRELAATVCSTAYQGLPPHMSRDRAPAVLGAVSLDDGAVVDACASLLVKVFDLHSHEGQHLHKNMLAGMNAGAGYHANKSCTFSQAAAQTAERLPSVLVHVRSTLAGQAAELGPDPAKPEGLLA